MAAIVKKLQFDARCRDCGAVLVKGTRARLYRRKDGKWDIYCASEHVEKYKVENGEEEKVEEEMNWEWGRVSYYLPSHLPERGRPKYFVEIHYDVMDFVDRVAKWLGVDPSVAVNACLELLDDLMDGDTFCGLLKQASRILERA